MFNVKQLFFSSLLVALSLAQAPFPNVSEPCQKSIDNALRPTVGNCTIPQDRTEAYMDNICLPDNVDYCIRQSRQTITDGCKNETTTPRVQYFHNYVVAVKFNALCLKDNQNKYCRKENSGPFCNECMPKRRDLTLSIMADASDDNKNRSLTWQAKNLGCSTNNDGTVRIGPTSSNAEGALSTGLVPLLACLLYLSFYI
jgi:hypothetical protein